MRVFPRRRTVAMLNINNRANFGCLDPCGQIAERHLWIEVSVVVGWCEISPQQRMHRLFEHRTRICLVDDVEAVAEPLDDRMRFIDHGHVLLGVAERA